MEMLIIAIFLLLSAGTAAYVMACHFTGETLLSTWWDEWRLRSMSLRELDAFCAANPQRSGLVVSLTTIPSRIHALAPTLKSLLRQTAAPEQIRLCLPQWSERESRPYELPEWLGQLRCITLAPCEDEGPATKFLSSLRQSPPDQAVVVVDDDRIYHSRLLAEFARLAASHPNEVIAGAGWRVPPDLIDRPTTLRSRLAGCPCVPVRANQVRRPLRVDIIQGVHAYILRPRFFDLEKLGDFSGAPKAVRMVDDVWVSAHCYASRMVYPLPLGFTDYKPWANRQLYDRSSLGRNVNHSDQVEQRGNSIALRFFRDRWGT